MLWIWYLIPYGGVDYLTVSKKFARKFKTMSKTNTPAYFTPLSYLKVQVGIGLVRLEYLSIKLESKKV